MRDVNRSRLNASTLAPPRRFWRSPSAPELVRCIACCNKTAEGSNLGPNDQPLASGSVRTLISQQTLGLVQAVSRGECLGAARRAMCPSIFGRRSRLACLATSPDGRGARAAGGGAARCRGKDFMQRVADCLAVLELPGGGQVRCVCDAPAPKQNIQPLLFQR